MLAEPLCTALRMNSCASGQPLSSRLPGRPSFSHSRGSGSGRSPERFRRAHDMMRGQSLNVSSFYLSLIQTLNREFSHGGAGVGLFGRYV